MCPDEPYASILYADKYLSTVGLDEWDEACEEDQACRFDQRNYAVRYQVWHVLSGLHFRSRSVLSINLELNILPIMVALYVKMLLL